MTDIPVRRVYAVADAVDAVVLSVPLAALHDATAEHGDVRDGVARRSSTSITTTCTALRTAVESPAPRA